ncbi:hypothetical protein [Acidovorax sp. Leaf160]|uniref:hypothetical protein n=1 Tax=Acidovorax sp. Leaf160 TaxID=1736280 RepID=UPI000700AAA7|nr:hypothetical protein [Acidovorax sp. Leaf160]KQR55654.1 hypothetical protein ASF94_04445 [Acidovorax sp. Leaf160]
MPLQHTGFLFLSKTKPEARTEGGEFLLTLRALDVLGAMSREPYVLTWRGPEAQAFWAAHQADLQPGAVIDVSLTHVRAAAGTTRPILPVLEARVQRMVFCPKRPTDERGQLWKQEQPNPQPAAAAA